jgi:hypothetical protein
LRRRIGNIELGLAMVMGGSVTVVHGQEIRIESRVACNTCRIVVDTASHLDAEEIIGEPMAATRGPSGRIYLYDPGDRRVKLFDRTGAFVRSIGRLGEGPGEYRFIRNLAVGSNGLLNVFDASTLRRTTYGDDGKVVSLSPMPLLIGNPGMSLVRLHDGRWAANSINRDRSTAGFAVQVFDDAGQRTNLLEPYNYHRDRSWEAARALSSDPLGGLFIVDPFNFRISRFDAGLAERARYVRTGNEFGQPLRTGESPEGGLFDSPFTPRIIGVWAEASDLLWVVFAVASSKWQPMPRVTGPIASKKVEATYLSRPTIDSVIEVIDLRQKSVLARLRVDGFFGDVVDTGYVLSYAEGSDGKGEHVLKRVRLTRQ